VVEAFADAECEAADSDCPGLDSKFYEYERKFYEYEHEDCRAALLKECGLGE
jgi:hypothetical protein